MKYAGNRKQVSIVYSASPALFMQGAAFNDEMQKLEGGRGGFFPKGAYCYASHDAADAQWNELSVRHMIDGYPRG